MRRHAAILATALMSLGGNAAANACGPDPDLIALSDYSDSAVRGHIETVLGDATRYFESAFDTVCISKTLNLAQANVLTGELRVGARFLRRFGQARDHLAITAMLGHETAHMFQARTGWFEQTPGRATTVRCVELYADYLAGGFVNWHLALNGHPPEAPRKLLYGMASQTGFLPRIGNQHGSPEERDLAFEGGYANAPDLAAAQMAQSWAPLARGLGCVDD